MVNANRAMEDYDVIVVGSGAAGLSAAIVAAREGLRVVVLEKSSFIGGTTALSGGGVWVPANSLMIAAGQQDSAWSALSYLRQVIGPEYNEEPVARFLEKGPEALDYLCRHSDTLFSTRSVSPDYYSDLPDATRSSRALDTVEFDGRLLGSDLMRLRSPRPETLLFGGMAVNGPDIAHFRDAFRSRRSLAHVFRRVTGFAFRRLVHGQDTRLVLGRAMIARMLANLKILGVEVLCSIDVLELTMDGANVSGVRARTCNTDRTVRARHGVILATGGFGYNRAMIRRWIPLPETHIAVGAPETMGDGIDMATSIGATLSEADRDSAYWVPASLWKKRDGTIASFAHLVSDRAKPGIIAVNGAGRRFVNEADSYHDFVRAMHDLSIGPDESPAYLVCDARALKRYGLGHVRPWPFPRRRFIHDGYLTVGRSLPELAERLGLPVRGLQDTIDRYNLDAAVGTDQEFGKGGTPYNLSMGDPSHQPNPCLAPIATPPFYAVRIYPGNLGTSRGIRTDGDARALNSKGRPIAGLYVVGNDADAVFQGSYPGPGASLGPALTGGYLAAMHVAAISQRGAEGDFCP